MDRQEYQNVRAQIEHFSPSWSSGLFWFTLTWSTTLIGLYLSMREQWVLYGIGQLFLVVSFIQHFVLMHECGHNTLTPNTKINVLIGHLSSIMAIIPFRSWQAIHRQHHLLAGWKNEDPTTKIQTDPRVFNLNWFQKALNRISWKLWIPFFSIMYRLGTYWNTKLIFWAIKEKINRIEIILNIIQLIAVYFLLFYFINIPFLKIVGPALYLSLAFMDIILLSQHNHIPMPQSQGKFKPHPFFEQIQYTRSLSCPHWLEAYVLFYFNRHEMHHCFPSLPAYEFKRYHFEFPQTYEIFSWIKKVKRMDALDFLFKDSNQTNIKV